MRELRLYSRPLAVILSLFLCAALWGQEKGQYKGQEERQERRQEWGQYQAQETLIVGTVMDALTLEPIQNASVYFKGTTVGCATNDEGVFMLRTQLDKKRQMVVSAVGYKKQRYIVEVGQQAGVEILLEEENTVLQDVFVRPDNDAALSLMRRMRENRMVNSPMKTGDFELSEQNQLFVSDISEKHLQRRLWQSMKQGMMLAEDSTYLLPLYSVQTPLRCQDGRFVTTAQPEEKSAILTAENYATLLNGLPHWADFYQNTIPLFERSFLSPLASSGNAHYAYYLADSTQTTAGKQYIVHFRSKNPFEATFNGEMTVDSASAALRHITVSVPREVSVNYLSSLRIEQTYSEQNTPVEEQTSMVFDLLVKADSTHIFPTILLTHQSKGANVLTRDNGVVMCDTCSNGERQFATDGSTTKQSNNQTAEKSNNQTTEQSNNQTFEQLEDVPVVKFAKFVAHIINTGNIPTGKKVDVGNIVETINYSRHEGFHLGVPLTTNESLWKNVELSGYVGYGFRDRAYKGRGQIIVKLPTEHRHLIGAYYWDHYVQTDISTLDYKMHENTIFYGSEDFTYLLFGGIRYAHQVANTATRRREFRLWTENEWTKNIETQFDFKMGRMGYGSPMVGYFNIPSYRYKTLQGMLRVGFEERKIDMFMRRYYVHSRYPVVRVLAEMGSYQTDQMDREQLYGRLALLVQQTVPLGMAGKLNYTAGAGIVIGAVPYPLLEHFVGNQSYTYDPYRFTLMNSYQYAADKYVFAHLHWNMQGLLFNRIPCIRYLKLRELLELKVAYGTLSAKNSHFQPVKADSESYIPLPDGMKALTIPYVETGVGIGNILRVLDLYAVFRVTNLKDTTTPWWAIRARFSLGL